MLAAGSDVRDYQLSALCQFILTYSTPRSGEAEWDGVGTELTTAIVQLLPPIVRHGILSQLQTLAT